MEKQSSEKTYVTFSPYFVNKGLSSQSYGFSSSHVWMWNWTIKKAECWRTDAFKLWYWRRLLRVPWSSDSKKICLSEQDSREVGKSGVHLSPWIHQEYTFRHRSACRTPPESGQEYLTSGKKYKVYVNYPS